MWLYPGTSPPAGPAGAGRHNGVLSSGTFTDANVIDTPPSTNCPDGVDSLEDVIALLNNGNGYVNVHTDDGVAPPNTGAGDFPGGEIRGNTP
ncbi:MAG: hypothetical protein WD689_04655 [Gaiellaceae bacterium]